MATSEKMSFYGGSVLTDEPASHSDIYLSRSLTLKLTNEPSSRITYSASKMALYSVASP